MMKNLLVLALVLSVASIVNAGLVVTPGTPGTAAIDAAMQGDQYMAIVADVPLSNFKTVAGGTASGEFFAATDLFTLPAGLNGMIWNIATFPGETYPRTGIQLQCDWSTADALLQGTVTRDEAGFRNVYEVYGAKFMSFFCTEEEITAGTEETFDYSTEVLISSTPIVPEPMTMLLLGLGGLFLRRK